MSRPQIHDRLIAAQAERLQLGLVRRLRCVDQTDGIRLVINGKPLVSFCSNDYLGLANHPEIIRTLKTAADAMGVGSTAAHLICGHRRAHAELEQELAEWLQRPRALLFSTGYMANLAVLSTLLNPGDLCLQDKLNHASLLDGARLAGAELKRYPHSDVDAAARQLASRPTSCALLATDGVFSMDGDIALLVALADLCKKQQSTLMIDDAHGIGVLGPNGAGSVAAAKLDANQAPIVMATLGKALGTFGAFVAGSELVIEALLQSARPYIYTTALPPALAEATQVAVRLARSESWRREQLMALIARFRTGAHQLGLPLLDSPTAIQPIVFGQTDATLCASDTLEQRGIFVSAVRPPTVASGKARLRITLSANHTEQHIDQLLDALSHACLNRTQSRV